MQIKARYLGQIARYTTIVLTAKENLSGEPVLISFNAIYIGEKKKKSLHPPPKRKTTYESLASAALSINARPEGKGLGRRAWRT